MLKAIHTQEDWDAAHEKVQAVINKLKKMKLANVAKIVEEGTEETLGYYEFLSQHWRSICVNNPLEGIMEEVRRRTWVCRDIPGRALASMLVAARLRHIAGNAWEAKRYLNMDRLREMKRAVV